MKLKGKWSCFLLGLGSWTVCTLALGAVLIGQDRSLDAQNFFGVGLWMLIAFSLMLWAVLSRRED